MARKMHKAERENYIKKLESDLSNINKEMKRIRRKYGEDWQATKYFKKRLEKFEKIQTRAGYFKESKADEILHKMSDKELKELKEYTKIYKKSKSSTIKGIEKIKKNVEKTLKQQLKAKKITNREYQKKSNYVSSDEGITDFEKFIGFKKDFEKTKLGNIFTPSEFIDLMGFFVGQYSGNREDDIETMTGLLSNYVNLSDDKTMSYEAYNLFLKWEHFF